MGLAGASALLVLVAALLLRAGAGDVTSPLALHDVKLLAVDVVLLATAAYGVVHAMGILRALDTAPYRPGMYLFPACVVDARQSAFRVWSVLDAEAIEVIGAPSPALALRMPRGIRVVVPAPSLEEEAQRAEVALAKVKEDLGRAQTEDNLHLLAELDPLADNAMSSPIGPTESMRHLVPLWIRLDWAVAAVFGLGLGLALGSTRNSVSDAAMYQTVTAAGTTAAYEQYLARGGRHSEEVREVLLPRVELARRRRRRARSRRSRRSRTRTSGRGSSRIDAAIRRALLAQLDKAKKEGTVTALEQFARDYPSSKLEGELKAARHALFVQALAAWKKTAKPDAAAGPVVERLLAFSRSRQSRVRGAVSPAPVPIDGGSGQEGDGERSLPRPRRPPLRVRRGRRHAFPRAARRRRHREALRGRASPAAFSRCTPAKRWRPTPRCRRPSRRSSSTTRPSGGTRPRWSNKPHTVFGNLNFTFDSTFVVPDGGSALKISTHAWRGGRDVAAEGRGADARGVSAANLRRDDRRRVRSRREAAAQRVLLRAAEAITPPW